MSKKKPKSPKFLLLFKDCDEITRSQVHSWPALHLLVKQGMIEFHKGQDPEHDTFRITEFGKKILAVQILMSHTGVLDSLTPEQHRAIAEMDPGPSASVGRRP